MTETEWITCDRLDRMLAFVAEGYLIRQLRGWLLGDRQRKLRLFLCACWRTEGVGLYEPFIRIAERYAEGKADRRQLRAARREAHELWLTWRPWWRYGLREPYARLALSPWSLSARRIYHLAVGGCLSLPGLEWRAIRLIREIFHPFRSFERRPFWMSTAVRLLAQGIVQDRDYERMVILADALEDAGCCDHLLLEHCRSAERHFAGCWVLDWLLGKQ